MRANLSNFNDANNNPEKGYTDRREIAVDIFNRLFKKHSPYSIYQVLNTHLYALPVGTGDKRMAEVYEFCFAIMRDLLDIHHLQNGLGTPGRTDIAMIIKGMVSYDSNLTAARWIDELMCISIEETDVEFNREDPVIFSDLKRAFIETADFIDLNAQLYELYIVAGKS